MAVSRANFRARDRIRGAEWFDEIAGAVGAVVEAVEMRGDDWAAQDLLVRFDHPVIIFDEPQWTCCHSAHNFEYVEDTRTALPAASLASEADAETRDETRYAKKRRLLRNHRAEMRIVQVVIAQHDLEDEVEERVVEDTGNNSYWMGVDSDMDESSDAEDPEATAKEELSAAKRELEDRSGLIEALTEREQRERIVLDLERIVLDLERERMKMADLESRLSRP